jgi:hypothetical protein
MAKLDNVPKLELCEWWEKNVGIDYYRVDHEKLIIEYDGRRWLIRGKLQRSFWWVVDVEGTGLSIRPGDPIEERHREIIRKIRASRFYHQVRDRYRPTTPHPAKHSQAEKAFAELENPQLIEVPLPEEGG